MFVLQTTSFNSISTHYQLQGDLDTLVEWGKKWNMIFNIDKCSVLHLGHKNQSKYSMQYDSKRISLKSTKCERDLGVHVDVDLVFFIAHQ